MYLIMYTLPILVLAVSILLYKQQTRLAHVITWSVATSTFTFQLPLIAYILLAVLWNLILLGVCLVTTLLPSTTRKGILFTAITGALIPNLFAHPLHVHPIRLVLRIAITYVLPPEYVWYIITPEWFIFAIMWKMLRDHYPIPHPVTPHPPPPTKTPELV